MLNINVDLIQRVKVSGLFFLQFYKIITGTLLTLFSSYILITGAYNYFDIYVS